MKQMLDLKSSSFDKNFEIPIALRYLKTLHAIQQKPFLPLEPHHPALLSILRSSSATANPHEIRYPSPHFTVCI